ncbi:hypothetical protein BH09ACT8_BH09ACT8_20210 [soil metagenome]
MLTGRQLSKAGTAKAAMVAINQARAPAAMTGHCSCKRAGSGGGSTGREPEGLEDTTSKVSDRRPAVAYLVVLFAV